MTGTTTTRTGTAVPGGVGESPARPDGTQKVTGEFAYSSDLWLDGMLWGATLRSPHPSARITGLDITGALAAPGVSAVLTHRDVPGRKTYGLEHPDQPVLAADHDVGRGLRVSPADPHMPHQVAAGVHPFGAGPQCCLGVGDRGEHLVIDRDRGGRAAGGLRVIGRDDQ